MSHGGGVKLCSLEGCTNQSVRGGVCRRHGAKKKLCSKAGCTNQSQTGGVCIKHGAELKLCSSVGCKKGVKSGGVCATHVAKRYKCVSVGCTNHSIRGGLCVKHGTKGAHRHAALMDVEINLAMVEEYVGGTEMWSSDAEWKAAEIKLSKGVCVFGMGQREKALPNIA